MEQTDRVLKQDAAGRVWTPPERREAVLDEFERSGLPAAQFAARIGVKYPTFANWGKRPRQRLLTGLSSVLISGRRCHSCRPMTFTLPAVGRDGLGASPRLPERCP